LSALFETSLILTIIQWFFWDLLSTLLHCRDSGGAVFVASLSRLQALYKSLQKPSFISVFLNQGFAQEVGVLYKSLHQPYKSLRQNDELLGETFLLHCRLFSLHSSKMRNNEAVSVFFIV